MECSALQVAARPEWKLHISGKEKRCATANLFKVSKYPLLFVIVRNMWLTGSDASCLQAMNSGRPMQDHSHMHAIPCVKHVFRDRAGDLLVYDLGLADQLRHALTRYNVFARARASARAR